MQIIYKYIALPDKPAPQGINVPMQDAHFPAIHAKVPGYELADDGEGNMVPTPKPNATLKERFESNWMSPNPMYKTKITAENVVRRIMRLKEGMHPSFTHRTYHVLPVLFDIDNQETLEPFMLEVHAMRNALDQATNDNTPYPVARLLSKEEVEANFENIVVEL